MPAFLEERYRRKHLNCVRHITLDPKGHGVVRIHMIRRGRTPPTRRSCCCSTAISWCR